MVAEVIAESLSGSEIEPVMLEVSQKLTPQEVALYDFFVVATPTYNARPSQLLLDFIDKLPPAHHKKAAYIIATYGLYPINCQRIIGQHLLRRGIRPVGFSGVRGPASDGSLLFSSRLSFMFNYEKRAPQKIHAMVEDIKSLAHDWQSRPTKLPAVIFHDCMKDKPRLTPEFYASHWQEMLKRISQL